jgi:predicted RNA-binding Zn-ribbon protein involved in translation (DUF1610 family)
VLNKENKYCNKTWHICKECARVHNRKKRGNNTKCIMCGKKLERHRKKYCLDCVAKKKKLKRDTIRNIFQRIMRESKNFSVICKMCGTALNKENKDNTKGMRRCKSCRSKVYRRKHKTPFYCVVCGKKLEGRQRKYCKKHAKNAKKQQDAIGRHVRYEKERKRVTDIIGDKCIFCGEVYDLHFHHIIPLSTSNTKFRQPLHYKRHTDILIPLCHKCHWKWHELKSEFGQIVM